MTVRAAHDEHVELGTSDPCCPVCNETAMVTGYRGEPASQPAESGAGYQACRSCGQRLPGENEGEEGAVVRVTENTAPAQPAAQEAIDGRRSVEDTRQLLEQAVTERLRSDPETPYAYCWVVDFTEDSGGGLVVYRHGARYWQAPYSITDQGTVGTVTIGDAIEVVGQQWFVPAPGGAADADENDGGTSGPVGSAERVVETVTERIPGRVLEAKGKDANGGRVYRVRIIAAGESKNGRIYPLGVLHAAASLYEGAKAYDHHRTSEELRTGTIAGIVGWHENVEATPEGLDADLHLLPSAHHAAEVLDAAIATQAEGRDPLAGISHDVQAAFRQVQMPAGRRMEATAIVAVQSSDVVAHPAAGGMAQRAVAGGIDPAHPPAGDPATTTTSSVPAEPVPPADPVQPINPTSPAGGQPAPSTQETDVPDLKPEDVLAALGTATGEQLAAVGLARAPQTTESTTPPATPPTPAVPAPAAVPAVEVAVETVTTFGKTEFLGRTMIRSKVEDAGLPAAVVEGITEALPERFTEAAVDGQIAGLKATLALAERSGLAPSRVGEGVGEEAREKKTKALDAFFAGEWGKGYRSYREAFLDWTGYRPRAFDEDLNRVIMRESIGSLFDSADRSTESLDSTSWAQALGDSVTRRMIAVYRVPGLQSWRRVVSMMPPINDFRTQRVARVGGYGVLPDVLQGAPYQPLTSPPDEEATYAVTKRGGTEDLTLEMIANDDVRAIAGIPGKLGRAAAQTLYRFVWDFFANNVTCTYDSTAFFHTNHGNTAAASPLSQTTLSAARVAMRSQTAYGDSSELLSIVPATIVVPNELEELAFQLSRSAVAVPATPAGPSDTPNIHAGLEVIVVDYWTDANDWFTVADPGVVPGIEVGFYRGSEEPELFTQSDPSQGSAFSNDAMTMKVRHIYGGTVTDHRVAYRGQG